MSQNTTHKNRKLHGGLLLLMLLLFLLTYNRRTIAKQFFTDRETVSLTPAQLRAEDPWNKYHADSALQIVKNGDLVFRAGTDGISNLFKRLNNRDKTYSHVGIAFIENGYPMVYNVLGTVDDPNALLRRDSLSTFINPLEHSDYAIYRLRLTRNQIQNLHRISIQYYKERRGFDPYFDLQTDSLLYCTEFVYKAVAAVTSDSTYFKTTEKGNFHYVSLDNLFLKKGVRPICRIGYKK